MIRAQLRQRPSVLRILGSAGAMAREFRIVGFIASGEHVEADVKGAFTTFVGYPTLF